MVYWNYIAWASLKAVLANQLGRDRQGRVEIYTVLYSKLESRRAIYNIVQTDYIAQRPLKVVKAN